MAMDGNALGNKIADDILAANGAGLNTAEKASVRTLWVTIANDITDHIDVNAQILAGSFSNAGGAVSGEGDIV